MDPENIRALIAVTVLLSVAFVIARFFVGKPKGKRGKADESEIASLIECVTNLVVQVANIKKDLDDAIASSAKRIKTLERQVVAMERRPA